MPSPAALHKPTTPAVRANTPRCRGWHMFQIRSIGRLQTKSFQTLILREIKADGLKWFQYSRTIPQLRDTQPSLRERVPSLMVRLQGLSPVGALPSTACMMPVSRGTSVQATLLGLRTAGRFRSRESSAPHGPFDPTQAHLAAGRDCRIPARRGAVREWKTL